ncbi:MAG: hypothetical protein Q7J04_02865, partial [Microcella sp.]|nr:hypothetical protein [Microcella sp.]
TLWRTPVIGSARVDRLLAPGESIEFEVRLAAVVCDPEAEAWPLDARGLDSVAPGEYELSATIGVTVVGDDLIDHVSSPRQTIRIE